MTKSLNPGDKVAWNTSRGQTDGTVEKKITSETKIKGHTAKPTQDDPQYLVRSEKSGARAAHKPDELKKR